MAHVVHSGVVITDNFLQGGSIEAPSGIGVQSPIFNLNPVAFNIAKQDYALARVRLEYEQSAHVHHSLPWSVTVNYRVFRYDGNNTLVLPTIDDALTINYDPDQGLSYVGHDVKAYPNTWRIEIRVLSVDKTGLAIIPTDVYFRGEIESA
jgi:uncharacterized protein YcfL